MTYETVLHSVGGPVATITLNRPGQLNAIVPPMPYEIDAAVDAAVRDGPFGDYSQAGKDEQPDPGNVTMP
jgi:enoyl-CoA hydratase/carnithine racemase